MLSEIWTAQNATTTERNDGARAKQNSAATSHTVPAIMNGMRLRSRSDARPATYCEMMESAAPHPNKMDAAWPTNEGSANRAIWPCAAAPSSAAQCASNANQYAERAAG